MTFKSIKYKMIISSGIFVYTTIHLKQLSIEKKLTLSKILEKEKIFKKYLHLDITKIIIEL